jgi:ubiquitin-protein ligase
MVQLFEEETKEEKNKGKRREERRTSEPRRNKKQKISEKKGGREEDSDTSAGEGSREQKRGRKWEKGVYRGTIFHDLDSPISPCLVQWTVHIRHPGTTEKNARELSRVVNIGSIK